MAGSAREPADTSAFAPLEPQLKLLTDDLLWWGEALATARAATREQ